MEYLSEILKILDGALKANASMASNYAGLLADKLENDGDKKQARMIRERLARAPVALANAQDAANGLSLSNLPTDGESHLHTVDVSYPVPDHELLILSSAVDSRIQEFLANISRYDDLARVGAAMPSRLLTYQWNLKDGTASIAIDRTSLHSLPGGSVRVIGPTQERLDGFLKWWKKRLRQMGYSGAVGPGEVIDDAFELFCEHVPETAPPSSVSLSAGGHKSLEEVHEADPSTTNGSSITAIVELGGTRVLMLADAWAEDVVNALQMLKSQGCSMMFDAVKVSHHGSLRNTSPELLELIDAPIYLVSTNGVGHGHPDFEVLAAIVDRPANFSRTILLNYATPASSLLRRHRSRSNTPFSVHENATDWITIGKS